MDDLYDPLGLDRRRPKRQIPFRLIFAAVLGVALLSPLLVSRLTGISGGGEPQAVAEIVPPLPQAPPPPPMQIPAPKPAQASLAAPHQTTIENAADVEHRSGVKVVRLDGGTAPGATIIEVPQVLDVALAPAPDPRLIEKCRYGFLPRIGTDGARPSEVYARPLVTGPGAKPDAPRIALVLGGVGLSRSASEAAIRLPGAVTLAFAPYGKTLAADVAAARARGHEVILQLPMEPID
ncbi:MAG TPA: divergent polysaccharide deacetylase family protein, partial [Stellaceae bacterium]|nr:divergent polysaccharide deacetylase family protein [Stellaceae bacterium]